VNAFILYSAGVRIDMEQGLVRWGRDGKRDLGRGPGTHGVGLNAVGRVE
jgi:hypothetical protein